MDKSAIIIIVHINNTNHEEIFEKGKDEPTERARVTEGEIKSKSLETAIAAEDFEEFCNMVIGELTITREELRKQITS